MVDRMDLFHYSGGIEGNYQRWVDNIKRGIRDASDIAQEIKAEYGRL
jgi:hypothetical protein